MPPGRSRRCAATHVPRSCRSAPRGMFGRMDARLPPIAVLAAVAASALAGCGTSGDRAASRSVVERFAAALQRQDGTAACALLGDDAIKALEQQEGKPCPRAVTSLSLGGTRVTRVQVYMTNAKVDFAGGASAFLDRASDGWRLSAVGCKASEGKPADRPLDCDLED